MVETTGRATKASFKSVKDKAKQGDYDNLCKAMLGDGKDGSPDMAWADFSYFDKRKTPLMDQNAELAPPSTNEAQENLQACFDQIHRCIGQIKSSSRDIARLVSTDPSKKTPTMTSAVDLALHECAMMEQQSLQDMTNTLSKESLCTSDVTIKEIMNKAAKPFATLKNWSRELIALYKTASRAD